MYVIDFTTLFVLFSTLKGTTIGTHGKPKSSHTLGENESYPEELEAGEP